MKVRELVPAPARHALRPAYYAVLRYWYHLHPTPIEDIYRYWKNPDSDNDLHDYATRYQARSEFLVKLLRRHVPTEGRVLEVGCNVGRNLNAAFQAGYRNLEGIELNSNAIELIKKYFPEMAKVADVHFGLIENFVRSLGNFECAFAMGVLQHIHPSSEWVFPELAKRAATVITIEHEKSFGWRWFPRNYKNVFESAGMQQIEEIECAKLPELAADGLENCTARVFKKNPH
jgi:SAM-dependent methyltransferase